MKKMNSPAVYFRVRPMPVPTQAGSTTHAKARNTKRFGSRAFVRTIYLEKVDLSSFFFFETAHMRQRRYHQKKKWVGIKIQRTNLQKKKVMHESMQTHTHQVVHQTKDAVAEELEAGAEGEDGPRLADAGGA